MPKQTYHHGDLRNALVQAGLNLIERGGVVAVSLRAVAREAGVSQSAPYAHFADKRSLMSAIAAAGFVRLRERLQLASSDESSDLTGLGAAYLAFAQENPGLYTLMFGPAAEVDPTDEGLVRAGQEAFAVLAQRSAPGGCDARQDPGPVAAWALVHGLAMLAINRRLPPQATSTPEAILDLLQPGIAAHLENGSEAASRSSSD